MEIVWAALIGGGATLSATILSYYFKVRYDHSCKHKLLKDHVDLLLSITFAFHESFTMATLIIQVDLSKNLVALTRLLGRVLVRNVQNYKI